MSVRKPSAGVLDGPISGAHIERDPRSGEDLRPNSDGMQCLGGQGAGAASGKVSASHMGTVQEERTPAEGRPYRSARANRKPDSEST